MRRYALAIALLVTLLISYGLGAWIIQISAQTATVHEGAGVAYPIIAQLKSGDKVMMLQEQGGWYQVILKDGKKGWLRATSGMKIQIPDEEAQKEYGLTTESPAEVDETQFFQKIGGDVVPHEIERLLNIAMSNQQWDQRKCAIDKLAAMDSPDAAGALMEIFDVGDADAAKAALTALSGRGDEASLSFIADRIKSPKVSYDERVMLIDALFRLGEKGQKILSALLFEIPEQAIRNYIQQVLSPQQGG